MVITFSAVSRPIYTVLKKLNLTQQKQTTREQSGKNTQKSKPKSKENLNRKPPVNFKNCSYVYVCITVHKCRAQKR